MRRAGVRTARRLRTVRRARAARWVAVVVALLTVAGCTGVPGSSGPQVVRTVGLGETPQASPSAPPVGASPREIVQRFFDAMDANPDRPDAARAYLDDDAAQKWSGSTVTVIRQKAAVIPQTATDADADQVKVSFQVLGTLSADGVYRPATLDGLGASATQLSTYKLAKNDEAQWRIVRTPVPSGLYVTSDAFDLRFTPKSLYFLDAAGTRLVPDLRYSALPEPSLENFLLTQLVAGPRSELQGAVTPFEPEPSGNQRLSVTPGAPTVVQIPGASALDEQSRAQLAAQVAYTLRPTSFQSELQIQDGTQVLDVPAVGGTFDVADFASFAPVADDDTVSATYVRDGAVVDSGGKPVPGKIGTSDYALDSAVFDSDGGRTSVAGTRGDADERSLLVGDANGLTDVRVPPGPLTAPAWAPVGTSADPDEVWVASGGRIYRYVPGQKGATPTVVTVAGQNSLPGTVTSLSFSPEGTRVLLVVRSPDGSTSQVRLAAVIRNGPDVLLGPLEQLTPTGYQITDAGWRTETLLAAVGTSSNFPAGMYLEVAVDGSRLAAYATDGLPGSPRGLAVSPRSTAQWVTIDNGSEATVWNRTASPAGSWSDSPSQQGYAPSFST